MLRTDSGSRAIRWLAFMSGLSTARARRLRQMRILMFHRVGHSDYPQSALEAELKYLRREFDVISLEEMVRRHEAGIASTGREVALTFDDGLRSHVRVAYPLLVQYGMKATFFVCPGLVNEGRWLWTHECRARLEKLAPDGFLRVTVAIGGSGWLAGDRRTSRIEEMVRIMKQQTLERRLEMEEIIRQADANFSPSADQRATYDLATWAELQSLDPEVVSIGSHSMTHSILPLLDEERLRGEVVESQATLESRLGRRVDLFCYPSGAEDVRVRSLVARSYVAAVSTRHGSASAHSDRYDLPRIASGRGEALLAWRMHRGLV